MIEYNLKRPSYSVFTAICNDEFNKMVARNEMNSTEIYTDEKYISELVLQSLYAFYQQEIKGKQWLCAEEIYKQFIEGNYTIKASWEFVEDERRYTIEFSSKEKLVTYD